MSSRLGSTFKSGALIPVGCLVDYVLMVDVACVMKNIWATSRFGLKVMLVGYLGVSGPCSLYLSYVTRFKIA